MTAPLLITRDHDLTEELMRLAAAAGVTPEVAADVGDAVGRWASAPLVLVGPELAGELAGCRLARRDEVYVVTGDPVPDQLFRVALDLGARGVVETGRSESWLVERLGQEDGTLRSPGRLVGVVGGSGGSGATTFACALGRAAAYRSPSLVVDGDPLGPGLDRVLGLEDATGVRWHELERTTGRLGGAALRDAVPRRDGVGVLTWYTGPQGTLQAFAVREVVAAGVRGHDLVVVDLPRAGGPLVDEVAARCDLLVVTVRPTVSGIAAAARVRARFAATERVGLVVRGPGTEDGEIAGLVGAPVLASMSDQRGLEEAVDLGLGPLRSRRGPLYRAAVSVLDGVAASVAA